MIGRTALIASAAALGAAAFSGCGAETKTVSVSAAPAPSAASGSQTTAHTTTTTPAKATTPAGNRGTSVSAAPAPSTPSATRTAPAPAFTRTSTSGEASPNTEAAAAADVVSAHGYTPTDISDYHPTQTLRVLLGARTGSADGYEQRAFFFLDGRYIGTDASQPSASIRIVAQSDTEVALAYALYRTHDPLCCPSGGQAVVHFQLDNGALVPLQPIPPATSATGLARQ